MKNYLLILLSVVGVHILINASPIFDTDISTEINSNFNSTPENILIPTVDDYSGIAIEEIATTANIAPTYTAQLASYPLSRTTSSTPQSISQPQMINYTITAKSDTIVKNPGSNIYRTNQIVYAHNSSALLGSIRSFTIGSNFTITENGITNTYEVADIEIFKKVDDYTLKLCDIANYDNCYDATYYMSTLENAKFRGKVYNLALMTCDGTSLGNGDATHRRVVFAYQK